VAAVEEGGGGGGEERAGGEGRQSHKVLHGIQDTCTHTHGIPVYTATTILHILLI